MKTTTKTLFGAWIDGFRQWWRGLARELRLTEYLLARHHHLSWHPELDGAAVESRRQALNQGCGRKSTAGATDVVPPRESEPAGLIPSERREVNPIESGAGKGDAQPICRSAWSEPV